MKGRYFLLLGAIGNVGAALVWASHEATVTFFFALCHAVGAAVLYAEWLDRRGE